VAQRIGSNIFLRGNVYVIEYQTPDSQKIEKLAVCLQEGKAVSNSPGFVGVLTTTEWLERNYPWEVHVSAEESHSQRGVRVLCGQLHTFPKSTVKRYTYRLSAPTMREIDKAILRSLSIAAVFTEDDDSALK
jgi:mRNA-degrading endonuclease toxin of MazEF toxin-antitoxin module